MQVYDADLSCQDITEYELESVVSTQNTGIQVYNTNIAIGQDLRLYGTVLDISPESHVNYRTQLFISWDTRIFIRSMSNGAWSNTDKYWNGWHELS